MRYFLLIFLPLLSWQVAAQSDLEKIRVARAIVYQENIQSDAEFKSSRESFQKNYKGLMSEIFLQFTSGLPLRHPKINRETIDDVANRSFSSWKSTIEKFMEEAGKRDDRVINSYVDYFSLEELVEILKRRPQTIGLKHEKFRREITSVLNSQEQVVYGEALGSSTQIFVVIETELIKKSKEKHDQ